MKSFLVGLVIGGVGFLTWQAAGAIAIIRGTQSADPGDIASLVSVVGFALMLAGPIYFWITRPLLAKRQRDKG